MDKVNVNDKILFENKKKIKYKDLGYFT